MCSAAASTAASTACRCCCLLLLPLLAAILVAVSSDQGTRLVRYPTMLLQRELLLAPRAAGLGRASSTLSFVVNKIVALPLVVVPVLLRHGGDFRRVLFNDTMLLAGDGAEYGPWVDGVAQFSHAHVRADQMDAAQQRGSYFGAMTVGEPGAPGTLIPRPCMSAWQLTTSSDDPKHGRVRDILHKALPGLSAKDQPALVLDAGVAAVPRDDVPLGALVKVVGMNVFNRLFGELEGGAWEHDLGSLLEEYGNIGALCAVGIKTGGYARVGEVVNLVAARISATAAGKRMRDMAEAGSPKIDGDSFLEMLAFGYLFAGQGGTSHLARSTLGRIRSDPARYTLLWEKNPRSFLIEQARIDPPVTSYTSLLKEDVTTSIMGKTMTIPKGTERQMFIVTANRDPTVFERAWEFDPNRKNLDKVLSWNGPAGMVAMGIAHTPRGCPGHSISMAVAQQVVERFRPKTGAGSSATKAEEL